MSLFSLIGEDEGRKRFEKPPKVKVSMSKSQSLAYEKELLGFYLTGHPLDAYRGVMQRLSCAYLEALIERGPGTIGRTCFIVDTLKVRLSSRTNKKYVIALIDDGKKSSLRDKVILFWNTYNSMDFSGAIATIDYHQLPRCFHRYFEEEVQPLEREQE